MRRLLLSLSLCLPLFADPPTLDALVRDLGSDSAATRDRASVALAGQPPEAIPALRAALEGAPGKDAEVAVRLQAAIRAIERVARRAEIWKRPAEEDLKKLLQGHVCTCGNKTPWKDYAIEHELLEERMPECRIWVLDWTCCQRKPVSSRVIVVCRNPDAVLDLTTMTDLTKLASRLPAVKTSADAATAGGIAGGLMQLMKWEGPFEFEPIEGVVTGDEARGFVFEVTEAVRLVFGEDGLLKEITLGRRR
jgi:hypothetical protein